MKRILILLLASSPALAWDNQSETDNAMDEYRSRQRTAPIVITPSIEGTGGLARDYSKPSIVIDQTGQVYQTEPGSMSRDWNAPKPIIHKGW